MEGEGVVRVGENCTLGEGCLGSKMLSASLNQCIDYILRGASCLGYLRILMMPQWVKELGDMQERVHLTGGGVYLVKGSGTGEACTYSK